MAQMFKKIKENIYEQKKSTIVVKNTISQMKNTLNGNSSRLNTQKKRLKDSTKEPDQINHRDVINYKQEKGKVSRTAMSCVLASP